MNIDSTNFNFNTYQDADDIAPYIRDYYFSDTLIGVKLELTESEILDYLYELGYKGDDRGKFLDMVISSLVNIGITIKQDDENYNEDSGMPFLKASMGIILPNDGFKVTFSNSSKNKTFMGANSMEEWQDYLKGMSEYERRDAIVTSIKYGHTIKERGELPEDYWYDNGGNVEKSVIDSDDDYMSYQSDDKIIRSLVEVIKEFAKGYDNTYTFWIDTPSAKNISFRIQTNIQPITISFDRGNNFVRLYGFEYNESIRSSGQPYQDAKKTDQYTYIKSWLNKYKPLTSFRGLTNSNIESEINSLELNKNMTLQQKYWDEKDKYSNGGMTDISYGDDYTDLSFASKTFYRTAESMIKEQLRDGEICICKLKKILGKTPDYPYQVVGSLVLKKCFLRPYYKI